MGRGGGRRGGFTLVELLVVIGIIAILATIGLVMASKAMGSAKRNATVALLQHIGTAIESFKNDFGDEPPLITKLADYSLPPDVVAPNAIATPEIWGERARLQGGNANTATRYAYSDARWMSEWSPAAFLLGVGDLNGDGDTDKDKLDMDDGKESFGFRHPGEFRAWTKVEKGKLVHEPTKEGKVYGPYLDISNTDKFMQRVPVVYDSTTNRIRDLREMGQSPQPNSQYLYRLVDSWGNPIRYYRNWQTYDPSDPKRKASVDFAPVELRSYESLNKQYEDDASVGDIGLDAAVLRAPYMLLSAGEAANYQYDDAGQVVRPAPFGDVVPYELLNGAFSFQDGTTGDFDQSFNPFDALSQSETTVFLKMIESNVRHTP